MKAAFISNYPAPYIVKMIEEANKVIELKGFFYERMGSERPNYWKIPLSENSIVLNHVFFKKRCNYVSLDLLGKLCSYKPDVLIIGGLGIPSNYMAYCWAKKNKIPTILFSEYLRDRNGIAISSGIKFNILKRIYWRGFDEVWCAGEHAVTYFSHQFGFKRCKLLNYPMDLDRGLVLNKDFNEKERNLIFPHRLESCYSPILAIEIVESLLAKNASYNLWLPDYGSLKTEVKKRVEKSKFKERINFIDSIKKWEDVYNCYIPMHVSISPCSHSNGNMAILEAMSTGCVPIVTNKVKFNNTLISENECGYVLDQCPEKFVSTIEELFKNKEKMKIFSNRSKNAVARFGVRNATELWVEKIKNTYNVY